MNQIHPRLTPDIYCSPTHKQFIISQVDYCTSILAAVPNQSYEGNTQLCSTRLVYGRHRYNHITDLIRDRLHWLPLQHRVHCKCVKLVYRALHGIAPSYIARFCVKQPVIERRYELRSAALSLHDLVVPATKTQLDDAPSLSPVH